MVFSAANDHGAIELPGLSISLLFELCNTFGKI